MYSPVQFVQIDPHMFAIGENIPFRGRKRLKCLTHRDRIIKVLTRLLEEAARAELTPVVNLPNVKEQISTTAAARTATKIWW